MNDLLSILNCSGQLRVNALADEDYFYQSKVGQVRPTHSREDVELLILEVGHESK